MTHLDTPLSLRFNLALGLIPGLIAILLAFFIPHEQAIYIGTLIGVLTSVYALIRLNKEPKQVLLFSTTIMLMLMSLSHSISICHCPDSCHSLVIEIAVTLPVVLVIFIQKGLRTHRAMAYELQGAQAEYGARDAGYSCTGGEGKRNNTACRVLLQECEK